LSSLVSKDTSENKYVILHPTPVTLSTHRAVLWRKVTIMSASEQ
jgi:hypothetical protein